MSKTYTVCVDDAAVATVATMTWVEDTPPIFDYDTAGCSVEEQFARYTFTTTVPSDEDYRIYFTYDVVRKVDGSITSTGSDLVTYVTMPAGDTQVYKDVLLYTDKYCGTEGATVKIDWLDELNNWSLF